MSGGHVLSICKQPSTVLDKLGNKSRDPWSCYLGALSACALQPVCVTHLRHGSRLYSKNVFHASRLLVLLRWYGIIIMDGLKTEWPPYLMYYVLHFCFSTKTYTSGFI